MFFSDFDGTIAKVDVGDTLLQNFGDPSWRKFSELYVREEINSQECLSSQFATLRATEQELLDFVDTLELDDDFVEFVEKIHARGDEIAVLSDGQSYYIERLLKKYGVDIPVYANRAVFENGGVRLEFPHLNPECDVQAANCKCSHKAKHPAERYVYIGDGASDRCAAAKVDLVYAKDHLLEWAQDKDWNYKPFKNFRELLEMEGLA